MNLLPKMMSRSKSWCFSSLIGNIVQLRIVTLFSCIQIQRKWILRIMPRFTLDAVLSLRHLSSLITDTKNSQKSVHNYIFFSNSRVGTSGTEPWRSVFWKEIFIEGTFLQRSFSSRIKNPGTFCEGHCRTDICIRILPLLLYNPFLWLQEYSRYVDDVDYRG